MGSIYGNGTGKKATGLITKGGRKVGSVVSGKAKEAWGDFWEEKKLYKDTYKQAKHKAIKQRARTAARSNVLGSKRMPRRKSAWDL